MRPDGHATRRIGVDAQRHDARDELSEEPEDDQECGGDTWHQDYRADEQQRANLSVGIQPQVRGQHTGDSAGGAEAGRRGARIDHNVGCARGQAAYEVEDQEAQVAEAIFDVIAKDEQVQHVRRDVQQAAVQKHAREERDPRHLERRRWADDDAAGELDRDHPGRHEKLIQ